MELSRNVQKTVVIIHIPLFHICDIRQATKIAKGLGYLESMLVYKDFQTWYLIGWQHSRQPIRIHVRKSFLISVEFNMDFTQ